MKCHELIEKLRKFEPDIEVVLFDSEWGTHYAITEVRVLAKPMNYKPEDPVIEVF